MSNLLIQQYGMFKKKHLDENPYSCLLNTSIEINPHQVDAFCAAVKALKTGGIILGDEVGLGKTIEAGLVIKYVIKTGAKKIMIVLPSSLRKQWEIELLEKFNFSNKEVKIIDRNALNFDPYGLLDLWLKKKDQLCIALTSYDFSAKLIQEYPSIKWDFIVIDEAHNLRNAFHGAKRAKRLYDVTKNIPKILLTATPLQNRLNDLHGIVSFIDDRIFGGEKAFVKQYINDQDYVTLKQNLAPVLYRTLIRDVVKYMQFPNRECRTFDFELSYQEILLYERVNEFLKRPILYSIPQQNRNLIILVIRKLLASSSFALVETFEVLQDRLEKLYQGSRSQEAKEGFDLFLQYLEDELDEIGQEEDEDVVFQKQQIQNELDEVNAIIEQAEKIKINAKVKALRQAIDVAFAIQDKKGIPQKIVIFTESKRTQKYIASELVANGMDDDDIVLFNGENTDAKTREIYRAYSAKNFGKSNYGPAVERKHAIVDYFKNNAKILILTDAGSEGLNLQFCNTVINYDLPWNPMKIEQRIGRCHRYGQKNDVVAINLLNSTNQADRRVYEILSQKFELFNGVFGASDIALGILESGVNFEQEVLAIYQRCNSVVEITKAFDKLSRRLDAKRNNRARELQEILLSRSSDEKRADLDTIQKDISKYLKQVDYWNGVEIEDLELPPLNYWRVDSWGEETIGGHGYLFVGAMCDSTKVLFPVLLMCDENGNYIDFDEDDLLPELDKIDDTDILNFSATSKETELVNKIYWQLHAEMVNKYESIVAPIKAYHKKKMDNWLAVQIELLNIRMQELADEAQELLRQANAATNFNEKLDWRRQLEKKRDEIKKFQESFHERVSKLNEEADLQVTDFNKTLEIQPFLVIKVVLKF